MKRPSEVTPPPANDSPLPERGKKPIDSTAELIQRTWATIERTRYLIDLLRKRIPTRVD